jgi:hypothetical protein
MICGWRVITNLAIRDWELLANKGISMMRDTKFAPIKSSIRQNYTNDQTLPLMTYNSRASLGLP